MDKVLLTRIKTLLLNCSNDDVTSIRTKLMIYLKPAEADQIYEYFLRIEPNFIRDLFKVNNSQILPQYNDYYSDKRDPITDIFEFTDVKTD
jgi:hypothetical protein